LQRQRVSLAEPVAAEARLVPAPLVERRLSARPQRAFDLRRLAVDPVVTAPADRPAVAHGEPILEAAARNGYEPASSLVGRPGNHVDHTVDGVRAPERGAGPADHLDPIHVGEEQVLLIPEDAREERRIDGAPVDQHEQLVADRIVEAARADRVLHGDDARGGEVRRDTQRLRGGRRSGAADLLGRDHEDRSRRVGETLRLTRYREHLYLAELLERQIRKTRRRLLGSGGRQREERDCSGRNVRAEPHPYSWGSGVSVFGGG